MDDISVPLLFLLSIYSLADSKDSPIGVRSGVGGLLACPVRDFFGAGLIGVPGRISPGPCSVTFSIGRGGLWLRLAGAVAR